MTQGTPLLAVDHLGFWKNATRLTALGTVVAACAAVATVIVAIYIGRAAGRIARSQKDIAAIDMLRNTWDKFFEGDRLRKARCEFIASWKIGQVDDVAAGRILNFMEDIAIYVDRELVSVDVIYDSLSEWFMHYWYMALPYVEQERTESGDRTAWCGIEAMIEQFHRRARRDNRRLWPWLRWLHSAWAAVTGRHIQGLFTAPPSIAEIDRFISKETKELDCA